MVPERPRLQESQLKRAKSQAVMPDGPGFGGVNQDALETLPFNEDQIPKFPNSNFAPIAIEDSSSDKVFYRISFQYWVQEGLS